MTPTGLILTPPKYIRGLSGAIVFLAGPIQSAADWQHEATTLLHQYAPELHIANPRRNRLDGTFEHSAQVDWETEYLRRSADNGVVLFWLAAEKPASPISELASAVGNLFRGALRLPITPRRAYAQTTRFELAEWKVRHERDGINLVVGIDQNFTNSRYIRRRLEQDCPGVHIHSTLAAACRDAANLALTQPTVGRAAAA